MKLKYPYGLKYSPDIGEVLTIKIFLNVESSKGPEPFSFLFDTGADVTSLPAYVAEKLGIELNKCPKDEMTGYEGTTVLVYRSKIRLHFNKQIIQIPCVFHPNEDVPILLGRAGILDRFTITLDGKKKIAVFEQIS